MSPRDTQPQKPANKARPKSGRAVRIDGVGSETPQPKKAAFLAALAKCGVISEAARACGIDRATHYDWMQLDPEYPERFNAAMEDATDELEKVARERAKAGSDTLLMFVLNGYRSDKFRLRHEHSGANGAPLTFTFVLDNPNAAGEDMRDAAKD